MLFCWAIPPQLRCKCFTWCGTPIFWNLASLEYEHGQGLRGAMFPVLPEGRCLCISVAVVTHQVPFTPCLSTGAKGGIWGGWEPPWPASVPEGSSFAPVPAPLHGLSLTTRRVWEAVLFPGKIKFLHFWTYQRDCLCCWVIFSISNSIKIQTQVIDSGLESLKSWAFFTLPCRDTHNSINFFPFSKILPEVKRCPYGEKKSQIKMSMCQTMLTLSLKHCVYFFAETVLGLRVKCAIIKHWFTGMKDFFFCFKEMDFRQVMEQRKHSVTLVLC